MSAHRGRASSEDVIELERRVAASPETLFAYFTDPERYRLWQGVDAELDPRPGGIFRVTLTGQSGQVARGEYLEVDPPNRVVFTWGYEGNDGLHPGASTVEVRFTPDGDGTLMTLRHSGLPSDMACRFHIWGWDATLDRLVVVAAGGDPGANPFADY
ncbi:MAG: activator of Hsp90 ATPase 1 family protein [Acidimicrobiales bacterium]|nr:activator of Hsp90 ATPase 1 family protein [Acidimicrobiales bacterium]